MVKTRPLSKLGDPLSQIHPRLLGILNVHDVDAAVDRAAQRTAAKVAEYCASVTGDAGQPGSAVEIAVEFVIPPLSFDRFSEALERELAQLSGGYAAGRQDETIGPAVAHEIAGGSFHQWRIAWGKTELWLRKQRWSAEREALDGVIEQSRRGWREIAIA